MSLTLIVEQIQTIEESSLPRKNKDSLIKSIRQALYWTPEQKEMYHSAVKEWDKNHPHPQMTEIGQKLTRLLKTKANL